MSKLRIFQDFAFLVFFILFLASSFFAVSYLTTNDVFDAKISYLNDQKLPYSLILNIDNKVYDNLNFNVEVIFKKENLVVGSKSFECLGSCEEKIELRQIFFDDYLVEVVANYNGKRYKKELEFELNKPESTLSLQIPDKVYVDSGTLSNFSLRGYLNLDYDSKVFFQAYLKENPEIRNVVDIDCSIGSCYFNLPFKSDFAFGDYVLAASTFNDVVTKDFKVIYKNVVEKQQDYLKRNQSKSLKLDKYYENLEVIDVLGVKKNISLNSDTISDVNKYLNLNFGRDEGLDRSVKVKPYINSIERISELRDIEESNTSSMKLNKRGFTQFSVPVVTVIPDSNPVVFSDEKVYFKNGLSYVDINASVSSFDRKLVPGIYKREKVVRFSDGSEVVVEDYFAYGLISINTKKPLYKKDELVEMLIVVLDRYGFLVSDTDIDLTIISPLGENLVLSSSNLEVVESLKNGVYDSQIIAEELGEYKLYAEVELDDMILNVSSYFNVVESYDFDILREVPATIDPWLGPFNNAFRIVPLNGYSSNYNFEEVFSSDFDIVKTDADEIQTIGDTTYLRWYNLNGISKPYYVAQVPLVTPYLYYLGNAKIFYDDYKFYENRSWLFAIDPAAKTCDTTSPCNCGALCAGGHETGEGTIDTCGDGIITYEFVNDIRVTSLNGSYFGVGDTVQICVDFQTDSSGSGDRVSIAYKDASSTWANSHVIGEWQEDNNNLNTHCVNQVLNNYVGIHHVRGKNVYEYNARPANVICDEPTYYDHDDVEIEVMDKINPSVSSWNLDNGTNVGNNLYVIRGFPINIFANWNLPLRDAEIRHNSTGSFVTYNVDSYVNNQTNYTFDTSNIFLFPNRGPVRIDLMSAWDLYFNLTGNTSPQTRDFNILAEVKVSQSNLIPSVGYSGINSTMSCLVSDNNVLEDYLGVDVNFYKDGVLLGTNVTNSSGWAVYDFNESNLGTYNITCNVSTNTSNYVVTSSLATATRQLIVKPAGSDITIPLITNVSTVPLVFSIGGVTKISANVTDNIKVASVRVYVRKPDLSLVNFLMTNVGGDMYEYTYSDTLLDGNYEYYIYALDNSSNPAYSSTKNFQVTGVRSFIGIQSIQKIFKLGQSLNLTDYAKVEDISSSTYSEQGDVSYIYYSFDTSDEGWTHGGSQDEWERGFLADTDLNTCQSGRCWCTDLNNNYNNNANNNILSPIIDMTGRTNAKVTFWREIRTADSTNDKVYFESYDGSAWNILYQNTIGANDQEGAFFTYYPSEVEGVSNAQFRFRMVTNANTVNEGFAFDSFNLSFKGNIDWAKSWNQLTSTFGSDVPKLSAIKIGFNITSYDSSGSDAAGTNSPDVELQIYDGTSYTGSYKCNLDSSKTYPYYCEFILKNNPGYFSAWNDSTLRNIQFRAIDLDAGDSIVWSDVKREYITPSIIENNGIGVMSAYLLEQFKNSTGGIVSTLHFAPISINPGEARQLSDFWTYAISGNFKLGNYSAYVALTDASGNVLQNEDDGSYINDSYEFEIQSLIITPIVPRWDDVVNESFRLNISLDTTSYGFGGWCGYSLDGAANITLLQYNTTNLYKDLFNYSDGEYEINFYCNDTDGDIAQTGLINFNVSEVPRIDYVLPTDIDNAFINRSYIIVNVSINDSTFNSSWIDFNSINSSMDICNFDSGITSFCSVNVSGVKNGLYPYRVCANDSFSNIGCSIFRDININKTLPKITIQSPQDGRKYIITDVIDTNISIDTSSVNLDDVWLEFNSNGTKFFMNNWSYFNWTNSFAFVTGYYTVQFFGNDTVGNIFNSSIYDFIVIPDKDIEVVKNITSLNGNSYFVEINIMNYGTYKDYIFHDFINSNFNYYDLNLINSGFSSVIGGYDGDMLTWNLSLNQFASQIISYKINGTLDYNLLQNFIVGMD